MVNPLVTRAVFPIATAILLGVVAVLVATRRTSPENRFASRAFAIWWLCAGFVLILTALPSVFALLGINELGPYVVALYLIPLPLAVGLCALLYYLVYLYTGRRGALRPLVVAYLVFLGFTLYFFSLQGTRHLEITETTVRLVGETRAPRPMSALFGLTLAGPILFAVGAYGALFFRLKEREPRYRVALVSSAFIFWFGSVLAGLVFGWNQNDWWPYVYQLPGLVAGALILLAYRPPTALRRRLKEKPGGRGA